EPRMRRRQRRVVESELRERAGPEVLDDHVRSVDEPIENRASLEPLEVERHAFLVAVDTHEVRALAVHEWRTPGARVVALAGLFDFDHARAHVGEQHRAVRTRQHARQIENGDTFERTHMPSEIIVYAGSA